MSFVNVHYQLSSPCILPNWEEFPTTGIRFPLMNHDALNEAVGGSIVIKWNPWGFHEIVSMCFWTQEPRFRLQECFHPVLSILDLEPAPGKTSFGSP
jgi:hypothetical protein